MITHLWGIRIWIWIYFLISTAVFISIIIYWYREKIRRKFYEMRFPEKIIRVIIHYKGGLYHEFWRLIPDYDSFSIMGKSYYYNEKNIIRDNDIFADSNRLKLKVDGKEYNLDNVYKIRHKQKPYPELHYFYNNPNPINFYKDIDIDMNSKQLEMFQENDLFKKLLTLTEERNMLMIIIVISIINALGITFIILKLMEVI